VIADADQDLLLFTAAQELVLAEQAAALLQITDEEATQRLDQLRDRGLVTRVALKHELPPAYRVTRDGAEQIDSALPPLQALDPGRYRHEIAIGWLWAAARHGQLGKLREVLTRREMQAADATLRSESLLDTPGATFKDNAVAGTQCDARQAYPDLALVQAEGGGWATLHVILTSPDRAQLRATLNRADPLIRAQLFLLQDDSGESRKLIEAVANELDIAHRVHVQQLAHDGIEGA